MCVLESTQGESSSAVKERVASVGSDIDFGRGNGGRLLPMFPAEINKLVFILWW